LAHWLVTGLPLTMVAPVLAVFLNLPPAGYPWLDDQLDSGHARAVGHRGLRGGFDSRPAAGGLLLSLLVLPLYVPTLIFGAEVCGAGPRAMALATPLALLAAISLGAVALLTLRRSGGDPRQFALASRAMVC
jgi:heme exporter protein B